MLIGELNVVVVVLFFAVVAVGARLVDRLMAPGRGRSPAGRRSARAFPLLAHAPQRPASASPVEKRKPTPGSVST